MILIRLLTYTGLCIMVCRETGPWTCGAVALIMITFEVVNVCLTKIRKITDGLIEFVTAKRMTKGAGHGPETRNADTEEEKPEAQGV